MSRTLSRLPDDASSSGVAFGAAVRAVDLWDALADIACLPPVSLRAEIGAGSLSQGATSCCRSSATLRASRRMGPVAKKVTIYAVLGGVCLGGRAVAMRAQTANPPTHSQLRWRSIGPPRAGRARALSGVRSQANVFYIGFDNGGVWRSTDFGSTWTPIFDSQPTGSIGAIAVAPSDPNIIYVGSGAGIIRPDLATGDGMYKSTDAGKTSTHLGLRDSQMIANIEVDPKNPNRLFVAALGHPYGPNEERGIFRSTDGGQTFQKVLYRDEYTSGNDVRIDPQNPNIIYAALWQQQQGFYENGSFSGTDGGIFKSTD